MPLSVTPLARIANSSPPSRATMSFPRAASRRAFAAAHQHPVAARVAEERVGVLEVVEIDEQQARAVARALTADDRVDGGLERAPVGDAR